MSSRTTTAIDLGALQSALTASRKLHTANTKALTKAREAHDRSRKDLERNLAALEDASRSIITNG